MSLHRKSAGPIALVTRLTATEEADWIARLSASLPDETLRAFHTLSDAEKQAVEIAIVANPDPQQVAALSNLAWIHSLWAGVERLVAELGASAPPIVRLVDPELSRVMAEAVLAWTYYLQRDMPTYRHLQQDRCWQPQDYRPPSRWTIGILGLGALGRAAAQRLGDAGFQLMGWSRSAKSVAGVACFTGEDGLEKVLQAADILVCLLPLTSDTRGLLNETRLQQLKPGASLINFARGPIIILADVIAALDRGQLRHAVLDVFDQEPLPPTSPCWDHPAITVLPHISAPTDQDSATEIVAANIRTYRTSGQIPPTIDLGRGY